MTRYVIMIVAAAAVAGAAMLVLRPQPEPPVASVPAGLAEPMEAVPAAVEPDGELLAEVERLRLENAELEARVQELQASLAEARPVNLELPEEWLQSLSADPDAAMLESVPPRQGEDEASREQRREEWRTQRQQFAAQAQERITDFLAQQYDAAVDRASQERISAISANLNEMYELRQLMRDAQTDEEREAVSAQLRETFGETRSLLREQQQAVMAAAAESLGLTTEAERQAYADSLRQVMRDPFMSMMGLGMGGRAGGPGDGRGRDRGPRGGDQP